jgi:hypothetical protein
MARDGQKSKKIYDHLVRHGNSKAYAEKEALERTGEVPDSGEPMAIKRKKAKYPETMKQFVDRRMKERSK